MNNKALSNAELELTQKMQLHFPRGIISGKVLEKWNGCKVDFFTEYLVKHFSKFPEPEVKPLIQSVGTATTPVRTEKFVARDKFIVDTSKTARVKISGLGSNFEENFLDKIEEPSNATTLSVGKLLESSKDDKIIAELGGEEKAETTLAEMFSLMEKQANGESGDLLTNGYANIFYIRKAGVLWAVSVNWFDDGWGVCAFSVLDPDEWFAGRQVFARNSLKS
jgi:hypothetical protein